MLTFVCELTHIEFKLCVSAHIYSFYVMLLNIFILSMRSFCLLVNPIPHSIYNF